MAKVVCGLSELECHIVRDRTHRRRLSPRCEGSRENVVGRQEIHGNFKNFGES